MIGGLAPLQSLLPFAHALIGRRDLPVPSWLFAWGASVVLILSFVVLSFAWKRPRLEGDSWRPALPWLSRLIVNRGTEVLAGALGVFLLGVTVWAGLAGTEAPDQNFALTFVYVTFWLGMAALSLLCGNVYRAFNPWRAIARAASFLYRPLAGVPRPFEALPYPERLGRWPAAVGVVVFVWLELISGAGSGLSPHTVAVATMLYTVWTLTGMAIFGVERWCDRAETFSVFYGMLSSLSVVEVRGDRIGLRRFLSGTVGWAEVPGSLAMIVVAIGGTSFDGGQEGILKGGIESVFNWLFDRGLTSATALRLADSIFLGLTLAGVAAVFLLGVRGMQTVTGSPPFDRMRRAFAHTLIPIALAYFVAHYFSLFVFQEQAQFSYLLSDPLGNGHDYFGTASGGIDYTLIGAAGVWYVQVAALVAGHVGGLVLGHDRAIAIYGDPKSASRSQQWMLAMMVLFTCFGLFLLSQSG